MKRTFPAWTLAVGIPAIVSVWLLAARLVWEQTVWTWDRGAQMVGFSLMHSGVGALLVLAVMISLIWPVIMLGAMVWAKQTGGRRTVAFLSVYAAAWALIFTPYGFWQRLFMGKFSGQQAIELMTYAAANGDIRTVDAFLTNGISVNAQGRSGTALHAAAVQAEIEMMEYLLAKGADVNAINAFGDSPMENARQAPQRAAEALDFLERRGGRLVRGSEEQRSKVIQEQVREDIDRMDKLPR